MRDNEYTEARLVKAMCRVSWLSKYDVAWKCLTERLWMIFFGFIMQLVLYLLLAFLIVVFDLKLFPSVFFVGMISLWWIYNVLKAMNMYSRIEEYTYGDNDSEIKEMIKYLESLPASTDHS